MKKIKTLYHSVLLLLAVSLSAGADAQASALLSVPGEQADDTALTLPGAMQKNYLGILGSTLKVRDAYSWNVTAKDGKPMGILVSSEILGKDIDGYMGKVPVFILIDPQHKIVKMAAGNNEESPDYLEMAEEELYPNWEGLDSREAAELEVDAVSGATYSSTAIIENVKKVLAAYNAGRK